MVKKSRTVPKKLEIWRAAIEDHKRVGKELIPPFQQIGPGTEQIYWLRDFLPEFLWLDALIEQYGELRAVRGFNRFLDAADRYNSHPKAVLDGTVSAFRFIATERREEFVKGLADEIEFAVTRPFKHVLSNYPQCPMAWMTTKVSPDQQSIAAVREAVIRLFEGKQSHASMCRALPLNRLFAHGKVYISSELTDTIEAIKQYPKGDKWRAESYARMIHASMLLQQAKEDPETFAWARYFWNSNLTLIPCLL